MEPSLVLALVVGQFRRLKRIGADGGYAGELINWAARTGGWSLQIVSKLGNVVGFVVPLKRWIVERTFAWLGKYRRLSKDDEQDIQSSETKIYLAIINLMLHRHKPG